ncbi:MAG: hypothetical protein U0798_06525 [Gemmataceae bacterium]
MGKFHPETSHFLIRTAKGRYRHRFGGVSSFRGLTPEGEKHPVHQLYELDLRDPKLGLADRFPHLTRLPLLYPFQFSNASLLYKVCDDSKVKIYPLNTGSDSNVRTWDKNFPFRKYPRTFPEHAIQLKATIASAQKLIDALSAPAKPKEDPDARFDRRMKLRKRLIQKGWPFSKIGGKVKFMQSFPEWKCPEPLKGCSPEFDSRRKEVFAEIWERPFPGFNLWSTDPVYQPIFDVQILFARCKSCGVIHSSNQCT